MKLRSMKLRSMKPRSMKPRRWRSAVLPLAALLLFAGARTSWIASVEEEIEVFGLAFRLATQQYVDEVRPPALLRAALEGMMSALDPYSAYIDSTDQSELDIITTGAYGGIGVTVQALDGRHVVSSFVDDAVRGAPLRIGDAILSVDGAPTAPLTSDALRRRLRGRPGTSLRLVIARPGAADSLAVDVVRREIAVRIISSVDTIARDLLIVRLDRFPRHAAEELARVLDSARRARPFRGLILDLRDNPGGMLESAVSVSELFLPRGVPVVSTRGGNALQHRAYVSGKEPYLPAIPMVVLVNQGSASASEIVAGALQDHDRAVLLGEPTYGKGLVQNIFPLSHGGSVKLTTSRYFTPSGRCIQKLEYGSSLTPEAAARVAADTQRNFRTLSTRRPVQGKGGIQPDVRMTPDSLTPLLRAFVQQGVIRDFAAWYGAATGLAEPPRIGRDIRQALLRYVRGLPDSVHVVLRDFQRFRRQLSTNDADADISAQLEAFSSDLRSYAERALERSWESLAPLLEQQFALQFGSPVQYRKSLLRHDRQAAEAARILHDEQRYRALLGR